MFFILFFFFILFKNFCQLVVPFYLIVTDGRPEEPHEDDADKDEKPHEPPPNLSNTMDLVTKIFYGQDVHTK